MLEAGENPTARTDHESVLANRGFGEELLGNSQVGNAEAPVLEDHLNASFAGITALKMLVADQSLVVGTASGEIAIYFRVRYASVRNDGSVPHEIDGVDLTPGATQVFLDRDLGRRLAHLPNLHTETVGAPWTRIRSFATHTAAVTHIATSPRVKGFASVDANGTLAMHHSTSERQLLRLASAVHGTRSLVFTPRGDGVVALAEDGRGHVWRLDNPARVEVRGR